jgi:hypothetical protein
VASDPERTRGTGRHAAPRLTVRGRMQLPVGRALALTAVPTALLMGSLAPKFALAASTKTVPVSSTTHETQAAQGVDCGKPATTTPTKTPAKSASKSTPKTADSKTTPSGKTPSGKTATAKSGPAATGQQTASGGSGTSATPSPGATSSPSPSPTPSATPSHRTHPKPIATLLGALGGLLDPHPQSTTAPTAPATTAPATRAPVAPKAETSTAPGATAKATTPPSATATSTPTTTPSPTATGHPPVKPPSTSTPKADPSSSARTAANRMCDASSLAAPMVQSASSQPEMPDVPWTLNSSDLKLNHTVFHGVQTVQTAGGHAVRVLVFTADTVGATPSVDIGNLDMSTNQNGQKLHVQGGPGSTSTETGGEVTMYVTSLSGTLAKAEGIPLAELGIKLTLTPDTLPQWLYDLVGLVPIPLSLEFSDATVVQQGQFGGDLTIPGMHLYNTPLN